MLSHVSMKVEKFSISRQPATNPEADIVLIKSITNNYWLDVQKFPVKSF